MELGARGEVGPRARFRAVLVYVIIFASATIRHRRTAASIAPARDSRTALATRAAVQVMLN